MSKTISARIDDTMHTMITDEANQEGITVNEKLKGMLNNHFNEEEKKEISQSQNETLEQEILENCKEQKNKMNTEELLKNQMILYIQNLIIKEYPVSLILKQLDLSQKILR